MINQMENKRKHLNNKGFSLVELIIVIAIMAVLVAVLVPQYLQYVEKSKTSADNASADTITNAVKVILSDDTYSGSSGFTVTWAGASNTVTVGGTDKALAETALQPLLNQTFVSDAFSQTVKSNSYKTKTYTWTVTYTNGVPALTTTAWA